MDISKLTFKAQEALAAARDTAAAAGHAYAEPAHLLGALLEQPAGLVTPVLLHTGAVPERIREAVSATLRALPTISAQTFLLD